MKAISVCGPWWWYLLRNIKPVENRSWSLSHRGALLIHAPLKILAEQMDAALEMARRAGYVGNGPSMGELIEARGHVMGQVTQVDCVTSHPSPFFCGKYGHVYKDAILFREPVRYPGSQGIFEVPDEKTREASRRAAANASIGNLFGGSL